MATSTLPGIVSPDKVVIIGAGMGGIAMGAQLKRLLQHENFEIYEKLDDVGGTWAQNKYPNLNCDVPSDYYSFSFFQNPDWTERFAAQPEILEHCHACVRRFQLASHVKLQQECVSIRWSEKDGLWTCLLRDLIHDRTYEVKARFVVTAMGVLNVPHGLDDLPILKSFGGQVFHTAEWRNTDFDGEKVMVIGNGCSANQVVPWILNEQKPKSLVQIARSEQWVAPFDNWRISSFTKWCLRYIPLVMRIRRWWTAYGYDKGFVAFYKTPEGAKARQAAADGMRSYMRSVSNPKYLDILLPKYELGAKRTIVDHGYLEATNRDNFTLIKCDGLQSVEGSDRRTLVDKTGDRHEVDIVILANGFKTQDLLTPMSVYGLDGKNLREIWQQRGGSEAYMGVSVSGFPNFFMLTGPNTLPSGNSTLHGIECSVVYITRLLRGVLARGGGKGSTLTPTADAEAQFNKNIQERMKELVYASDVESYFINKETGKNTLIWPGTQFSFYWSRCISPVKWSDWVVKRV